MSKPDQSVVRYTLPDGRKIICASTETFPPKRMFEVVGFGFALYELNGDGYQTYTHQGLVQDADEAIRWCKRELPLEEAAFVIRIYGENDRKDFDD